MRKQLLAVSVLSALCVGGTASAAHQTETITLVEGDAAVGSPAGSLLTGISEFNAYWLNCPSNGALDRVDGLPFPVPADAIGRTASLKTTGALALDADVFWYNSRCELMEDLAMSTAAKDETGVVPAGATYGIANFTLGAQAHLKVTYVRPKTH